MTHGGDKVSEITSRKIEQEKKAGELGQLGAIPHGHFSHHSLQEGVLTPLDKIEISPLAGKIQFEKPFIHNANPIDQNSYVLKSIIAKITVNREPNNPV